MAKKDVEDERVTLHPLEFDEAMKLLLCAAKKDEDDSVDDDGEGVP